MNRVLSQLEELVPSPASPNRVVIESISGRFVATLSDKLCASAFRGEGDTIEKAVAMLKYNVDSGKTFTTASGELA